MFKNKIKSIILLYFSYKCFVEIPEVLCSRDARDEKSESGKDDAQSRVWRDQWKEQSKWQVEDAEPYISVVRGRSREWSNLEHSQPLKRSDDAVGCPNSPLTNDLGGLNISNPISKYHCPINLLYGNNLTVKNYFLLVPRANESCNDTVQQIQSVSEEKLEAKAIPIASHAPVPQAAEGATVAVETITEAENTSSMSEEITSENSTTPAPNTTVESTTEQSTEMNTTVADTAATTEFSVTFYSNVDNKTMEVVVELFTVSKGITVETTAETKTVETKNETMVETKNETTVETKNETKVETKNETSVETKNETMVETKNETMVETKNETTVETTVESTTALTTENTTSPPSDTKSSLNISEEIMRTVDKYCETFNLTDQKQYTINPVTIGSNIEPLVDGKIKGPVVELKKQKRTPLDNCVKFNMSGDQNYTIQPVAIPQDNIRLSAKAKVVELKKKKRNLTSKRPKKRSKLVR